MQSKIINPFLNASMNLFKEHLEINITAGRPFLNNDAQNLFEVSAIIGLAGDTQGAVVLSFKRETAIELVSKLVGKQFNALTNEVIDGVGEMANIIVGNAKKDISDSRIEISLPGVITGTGQQINWPAGIPVVTIPFHSPMGDFTVNVSLRG